MFFVFSPSFFTTEFLKGGSGGSGMGNLPSCVDLCVDQISRNLGFESSLHVLRFSCTAVLLPQMMHKRYFNRICLVKIKPPSILHTMAS